MTPKTWSSWSANQVSHKYPLSMSGGPATVRSVASKASATRSKSKSSLSTVGRAGQSSAVPAKSVNGWLSVFPATVEFNGIAAGSVYALNIRIMNTSKSSLRVRVQPPKQPSFRVNFPKGTGVAPGLELLAEVQFVCDVAQVLTHV